MPKITKNDISHVAKLSRLKIEDDKIDKYTQELESILDYVEELDNARTENVESIDQIAGLKNIARKDEIKDGLSTEKVLQNAPQKQDNFIKVKQVFE